MALSIEEIGEIDHVIGEWCLKKVPPAIKAQVDYDYEIDGQAVVLLEVRPVWQGAAGEKTRRPFAKFRWVKSSQLWHIYWMRQSGKWHSYEPASEACTLEEAVDIMELDDYGCFFG